MPPEWWTDDEIKKVIKDTGKYQDSKSPDYKPGGNYTEDDWAADRAARQWAKEELARQRGDNEGGGCKKMLDSFLVILCLSVVLLTSLLIVMVNYENILATLTVMAK